MEQNIKKGKRKKNREEEEDENFRKYTGLRFFHLEAESDNIDFKLQMLFIVCCVKCFNETFSTHLLPCNCNPIFYYFFYQYCILLLLLLLYYYVHTYYSTTYTTMYFLVFSCFVNCQYVNVSKYTIIILNINYRLL